MDDPWVPHGPLETARAVEVPLVPAPANDGVGALAWSDRWLAIDGWMRCLIGGDDLGDDRSTASLVRFQVDLFGSGVDHRDDITVVLRRLAIGQQRSSKDLRVSALDHGRPVGLVVATGVSATLAQLGFGGSGWLADRDVTIRFDSAQDGPVRRPRLHRAISRVGPTDTLRYFGLRAEPGDKFCIRQRPATAPSVPARPAEAVAAAAHVVEFEYSARYGANEGDLPNPEYRRVVDAWNRCVSDRERLAIRLGGSPPIGMLPTLTLTAGHEDHEADESDWVAAALVTDPFPDPAGNPNAGRSAVGCQMAPPTLRRRPAHLSRAHGGAVPIGVTFPNLRMHDGAMLACGGRLLPPPPRDPSVTVVAAEPADFDAGRFTFDLVIGGPGGPSAPTAGPTPMLRIGSLDLEVGQVNSVEYEDPRDKGFASRYVTTLTATWPDDGGVDDVADEVVSRIAIPVHRLTPAAQDPVPRVGDPGRSFEPLARGDARRSEARIAGRFADRPPLVLPRSDPKPGSGPADDLPGDAARAYFLLEGRDNKSNDPSAAERRVVSLNLFRDATAVAVRPDLTRVVVLDRQPMLVAQVEAPSFTGTSTGQDPTLLEVGNWSSDAAEAPAWQLRGGDKGFDLILPSQSIGEQMERSHDLPDARNGDVPPVDWRLSPPARLTLTPSYNVQRFPEAAWNLRRILGYAGQRAPGAGVLRLQFELLYGMGCDVKPPDGTVDIRLAELESRLGGPRGPLARSPVWAAVGTRNALVTAYGQYRANWSRLYAGYQTRLSVLQPYSDSQPQGLLLERNVTYTLRSTADLAYPVASGIPPAGSVVPRRLSTNGGGIGGGGNGTEANVGLEGGVAWGFESAAAYEELWSAPVSTAGKLVHPAFSMLGGWGYQRAVFSGGKQVVHSTTAMGRVSYFSLERIGRIGVLWNAAKHVIIYERTVVPAQQFVNGPDPTAYAQNPLLGRPVLRKVDEYVEVTEPSRAYPEGGAAAKTCGCLTGCTFRTPRMRVNSARLTDLPGTDDGAVGGFVGYTIPIWNPDDAAANPDVYPRPHIDLQLAAAAGGKDPAAEVRDPSQLVFYTSTRKADGPDTSTWAAVHDVDYVDVLPCHDVSVPSFDPDLEDGDQADGHAVEPGFERFTFALMPTDRLVNLAAGRAGGDGQVVIGAALHNLTFMRSKPVAQAVGVVAGAYDAAVAVQRQVRDTADGLQHLMDRAVAITSHVQSEANRLVAEGTLRAEDAPQHVADRVAGLQDRLHQLIDQKLTKLPNPFNGLTINGKPLPDVSGLCEAIGARLGNAAKAQLQRLSDAAVAVVDAGETRCLGVWRARTTAARGSLDPAFAAVADEAQRFAAADASAFGAAAARVDAIADRLNQLHQQVIEPFVALHERISAALDQAKRQAAQAVAAAHAFQDQFDEEVRRADAVLRGLSTVLKWLNLDLPPATPASVLLAPVRKKIGDATDALESQKPHGDAAKWFSSVSGAIAALDITGGGANALRSTILAAIKAVQDCVDKALSDWQVEVSGLQAEIRKATATAVADGERQIGKLFDDVKSATAATFVTAQTDADAAMKQFVTAVCPAVEAIGRIIGDGLRALGTTIGDGLADAARSALGNADVVGELRELQRQAQTVEALVGRQVANAIHMGEAAIGQAAGQAGTALHQAADPVLRTLRAFGDAPIVQGLDYTRKRVGYLLDEARDAIGTTPLAALPAKVAGAVKDLIPQRLRVPTRELLDKLLPDDLKNFDLTKLVPSFGGIELGKMLPGLKMPAEARDNVKITHGLDRQAVRAWLKALTLFKLEEEQTLFNIAGLRVSLANGVFQSTVDVSADASGGTSRSAAGSIRGDWALTLGSFEVVRFRDTSLEFRDGQLHFDLSVDRVVMSSLLQFLSDLINKLKLGSSGNGVRLLKAGNGLPVGVAAALSLPLPPLGGGTTAIVNLSLNASFELRALDDSLRPNFSIGTSIALSTADAPFAITFFILGGSGYLEAGARYAPAQDGITVYTRFSIYACAMLAVALGPIHGSVFIGVGCHADLSAGSGRPVALSVGADLLLRGEVDVCGIVSAQLEFHLSISYEQDGNGSHLVGVGELKISIKICWCFTLNVSVSVRMQFNTSGSQNDPGRTALGPAPSDWPALALGPGPKTDVPAFAAYRGDPDDDVADPYVRAAQRYLHLFDREGAHG